MANFNYNDFLNLHINQVLKMKLKGHEGWIFVQRIWRDPVQPYQPEYKPVTKITLDVIENVDKYWINIDAKENIYQLNIEPEEIEEFNVIEL